MTILFGFLNPPHSSQRLKVAFGKQENTMDHLVHFETFVKEGFLNGEHVVSISFDVEKAYDTT